MKINRVALFAICGLLYGFGNCFADVDSVAANNSEALTPVAPKPIPEKVVANSNNAGNLNAIAANTNISGDVDLIEGQIEKGYGTGQVGPFEHAWIQQASGLLKLETNFNAHTRLLVEGQADVQFSYTIPISLWDKEFVEDQKVAKFSFWLKQAEGIYSTGELGAKTYLLKIGIGEFEYKYNPDVRNLGEYLFRASAYPVYFLNWFDGAYYRMAGMQASTRPVAWFNFDLLLFSELYQVPLQDFSLAGVSTFKIGNIAELGAGIDFNRLFSVDERYTTNSSTTRGTDNIYSRDSVGVDTIGVDPNTGAPRLATEWGNEKYYTFRSIKVEFRGSIDVKEIWPARIFGKEDLKLYSECAILGLENYPTHNPGRPITYYANMSERCPVMVGFNFPAFNILDVLSLELEYFKSPFLPSSMYAFNEGIPKPDAETPAMVSIMDTKWSIYAKKRIGAFMVIAQAARDHYQPGNNNVGYTERGDVMTEANDWWWALKLQYGY